MRAFFTLWRRELAALFLSPLAYGLMAFFLLVMGASCWMLVQTLAAGAPAATVMGELLGSIFFWLAVLLTAPLLTMRPLAEERRNGTLETLLTAPVRDPAIVLAKYAGALTCYLALWLPTLLYIVLLRRLPAEPAPMDPGQLAAGYLGAAMVGADLLAIGLFVSSFCRQQLLAAMAAFGLGMALFLLGFLPYVAAGPWWQNNALYASVVAHMLDFSQGVVDTRAVAFHLINSVLFLYLTVQSLRARRWW